ncbi:MAG TPA: Hint domain-containing protein [Armatimonadota bacterium]|nr:Hint domain-containing protein [Armatimonadota bacterium]
MMVDGVGEVEEAGTLGEEGMQCLTEGGCFVAGTIVQTEHGPEPIEKVKKGEKVWTRNPLTGKTELKPVLEVLKHTATELVTIKLVDAKTGKTAQSLTGTPEHLFFTPGGKMVAMGDLRGGQQVVSRVGETLDVQAVTSRHVEEGVAVYNLTVEDDHTYFIGTADGGEWVHNACTTEFHHLFPQAQEFEAPWTKLGIDADQSRRSHPGRKANSEPRPPFYAGYRPGSPPGRESLCRPLLSSVVVHRLAAQFVVRQRDAGMNALDELQNYSPTFFATRLISGLQPSNYLVPTRRLTGSRFNRWAIAVALRVAVALPCPGHERQNVLFDRLSAPCRVRDESFGELRRQLQCDSHTDLSSLPFCILYQDHARAEVDLSTEWAYNDGLADLDCSAAGTPRGRRAFDEWNRLGRPLGSENMSG